MHEQQFKDFVSGITTLTHTQRRDLLLHLKHTDPSPAVDLAPSLKARDVADDWLAAGIAYAAYKRGLLKESSPRGLAFMASAYITYKKKAPEVKAALLFGFASKRPERYQLEIMGRMVGEALFEHIYTFMPSPSVQTVLINVDKSTEVIERAFPGYLACRLFDVVTRSIQEGHA